jgi:hypothetical protein
MDRGGCPKGERELRVPSRAGGRGFWVSAASRGPEGVLSRRANLNPAPANEMTLSGPGNFFAVDKRKQTI